MVTHNITVVVDTTKIQADLASLQMLIKARIDGKLRADVAKVPALFNPPRHIGGLTEWKRD